jgi:hypothetical protein
MRQTHKCIVEMTNAHRTLDGNLKGTDHLGNLDIDGRITIKKGS